MDTFLQFDGNLLIGIQNALNAEWLTPIMKVITAFGEFGNFWIFLCLVLMLCKKTRRLGFICTASLALTFISCNMIIKPIVNRTRPWEIFAAVVAMLPDPGDASFPSGHTANSIAPAWAMFIATMPAKLKVKRADGSSTSIRVYDGVTCLGWKGVGADPKTMHMLSIVFVILALLVGLSRLYLGMHFPSDVFFALILGMLCATVVWNLFRSFERTHGVFGSRER